jgi:hypothetical protein
MLLLKFRHCVRWLKRRMGLGRGEKGDGGQETGGRGDGRRGEMTRHTISILLTRVPRRSVPPSPSPRPRLSLTGRQQRCGAVSKNAFAVAPQTVKKTIATVSRHYDQLRLDRVQCRRLFE